MSFRHGKSAAVTVNAVNLSAFSNEGSLSLDIDTAETSAFGQDWKTNLAGQGGGSLELSGHYDPVAGGPGATIFPLLFTTAAIPVVWYPGGNVTGQTSYTFNAIVTGYTEGASTGDRVTFSATLMTTGVVTRATV